MISVLSRWPVASSATTNCPTFASMLRNHGRHPQTRLVLHRIVVKLHTVVELLEFVRRIDRCVDGVKRHIDEPRRFLCFDPPQGLGSNEFGGIAFFVKKFSIAMPGVLIRTNDAVGRRHKLSRQRAGKWIDQSRLAVESLAVRRVPRTVGLKMIELPGADAGDEHAPNVPPAIEFGVERDDVDRVAIARRDRTAARRIPVALLLTTTKRTPPSCRTAPYGKPSENWSGGWASVIGRESGKLIREPGLRSIPHASVAIVVLVAFNVEIDDDGKSSGDVDLAGRAEIAWKRRFWAADRGSNNDRSSTAESLADAPDAVRRCVNCRQTCENRDKSTRRSVSNFPNLLPSNVSQPIRPAQAPVLDRCRRRRLSACVIRQAS